MKRLFIVCVLLGRMYASNPCAEHNIYLSSFSDTISKTGAALCKAGTVGSQTWGCANGGMTLWGFDISAPCDTSFVTYAVATADTSTGAGHKYDLGLYYIKGPNAGTLAGRLMVHTGYLDGGGTNGFSNATGLLPTAKTWVGTSNCSVPCSLPAGQYALGLTTDCSASCAALWGDENKGYMYLFDMWLGGDAGTHVNGGLVPNGCGNPCNFNPGGVPGLPLLVNVPATDPALWQTSYPKPPAVLIF